MFDLNKHYSKSSSIGAIKIGFSSWETKNGDYNDGLHTAFTIRFRGVGKSPDEVGPSLDIQTDATSEELRALSLAMSEAADSLDAHITFIAARDDLMNDDGGSRAGGEA